MKIPAAALLFLVGTAQDDLGDEVRVPDYRFSIRPPMGWERRTPARSIALKYAAPVDSEPRPELAVRYVKSQTPEPMGPFVKRLIGYLEKKFQGHETLSEREFACGPYPAYRRKMLYKASDGTEIVLVRTVIHRSHHEYYFVDGSYLRTYEDRFGDLVLRSIDSFRILPREPSGEEKEAAKRFDAVMSGLDEIPEGMLGERWQTIHMGGKKIGHQMQSLTRGGKDYVFSIEINLDFGKGGGNTTRANGSFSADGSRQTVSYEEIVVTGKGEKLVFKAKSTLEGGKVRVERDMVGEKEARDIEVGEGVVLREVADFFRRLLVSEEKGQYAIRRLSPFEDDADIELIEVSAPDRVEFDGEKREIRVVHSKIGRRITTYWFSVDLTLLRVSSARSPMMVRAATKEEAVGGE